MAPAAVDVHKPNRRFMVRRRSGHAIAPAVVYDARLATPRLGSAPVPMAGEGSATGYPRASGSSRSVLVWHPPWRGQCQHRGWMLRGRERTVTRSVAWRKTPGVVQQLLEQGGVLRTDRVVEMEVQIYGLVQVLNMPDDHVVRAQLGEPRQTGVLHTIWVFDRFVK